MYEKNVAEPFVISELWVILSDSLFLDGKYPVDFHRLPHFLH